MPTLRTTTSWMLISTILGCGIVACDTSPRGPLADLAEEWSGVAAPQCHDVGPRGEPLGPVPGSEYCEWVGKDSAAHGFISGRRFQRRLASVTWPSNAIDSATVAQQQGTILASMKRRGLVGHGCELVSGSGAHVHGTRWESTMLVVQMNVVTLPEGGERMFALAGDVPSVLPPLPCKPKSE